MKHWKDWLFPGSFILTLMLIAGCRMPDFDSVWRDREIAIDGKDARAEWENARYYFEKKKVTVGLMNDADKLYIRISTRDRSLQRQLMALGCTMWFDESGKKDKKLGIRFPLGIQGHTRALAQGSARFGHGADSTQVDAILDAVQTDLALIGPYPDEINKLSVTEASKYDIACRIGLAEGNLVYELQYPLRRTETCPYGIFTKQVKSLKIGFITPKVAARRGGSRQGSMSPELMGGGMRGGSGRRGGMGQPNMPNLAPEPLELWITVKIAGKPADALVDSADMEAVVSAADSAGRVK